MEKKRLFYLDFIRTIALFIILVVHFNATITNMFTLPSKFTGSVLPGGIYLGELGSGLFFMISGAALGLTLDRPFRTGQFYQKRVKAIYPMFYIAFLVSFGIRFTENPAYYAAVPSASILYTVFGIDMFAMSVGWSGLNFACVGEWFTGVILILYLMFPVFRKGVSKVPFVTAVLAAALFIPLHLSGIDRGLVFLNALKFLFGIYFTKYRLYEKKLTAPAGVILSLSAVLLFPPLGIPAGFGALFLARRREGILRAGEPLFLRRFSGPSCTDPENGPEFRSGNAPQTGCVPFIRDLPDFYGNLLSPSLYGK